MPDELEDAMQEFKQELEDTWTGPEEPAEEPEEPVTPEPAQPMDMNAVADIVVRKIAEAAREPEEPEDTGYEGEYATAEDIERRVTAKSLKHLNAVQSTMETLDDAFNEIGDVPADIKAEVKQWFRTAQDPSSFTPDKARQAVDFAIGKAFREGRYKPSQTKVRSSSGPQKSLSTPGEGTPGIPRQNFDRMKGGFGDYLSEKEIAEAYKEGR